MRAAIFYATREGQSRRVADHIAGTLRTRGIAVDVCNVKDLRTAIDWPSYQTALLVASVHAGHHESEIVQFAKEHRLELARLDASFLSLTLSQAGAENSAASPDRREHAAADAQRMIDVFVEETGWHPAHAIPVAGALAYSQYNFLKKWIMQRIAKKAGGPTDTSRDYEFTNWGAVDGFVMKSVSGS